MNPVRNRTTRPIITNAAPCVELLGKLYLETGFAREVQPAKLARAIENSSRWWCLKPDMNSEPVGIGRCLSDWVRYACIYDVIIQKRYRGRGLGTMLMERILVDLLEADLDLIHLWPSKGRIPFYQRLGFFPLSVEQPVMKLDQEQAGYLLRMKGHDSELRRDRGR